MLCLESPELLRTVNVTGERTSQDVTHGPWASDCESEKNKTTIYRTSSPQKHKNIRNIDCMEKQTWTTACWSVECKVYIDEPSGIESKIIFPCLSKSLEIENHQKGWTSTLRAVQTIARDSDSFAVSSLTLTRSPAMNQ